MSNSKIEIDGLSLDEFGRVVLAEDVLDQIEQSFEILTAGGVSNTGCSGTNQTCSNTNCGDSWNSNCSNSGCEGTTNNHCGNRNEVDGGG